MDEKKFLIHLKEVLNQKGLTLKSSLKELSKTYSIDEQLELDLESRVENSPDALAAHSLYYDDLISTLKEYDQPGTAIVTENGDWHSHSDYIQKNIKAGKNIQIGIYGSQLYVDEELEENLFVNQLETNLERLARFYCIVTFLPKLSKKMKTFYEFEGIEGKGVPISNNLPLKTVGLNLMFLIEIGMLDKLIKRNPSKVAALLISLFPDFKGQSETLIRYLSVLKSDNVKEKNHPYSTTGNREKVMAEIKKYFP